MTAAEQVAAEWERAAPSLLGEDIEVEDWTGLAMLLEVSGPDLLDTLAASDSAATDITSAGSRRPPRNGRGRCTAYGPPTAHQIAPERYVPRPTRSRGRVPEKQRMPEAQRKRVCIDLTGYHDDEEEEGAETETEEAKCTGYCGRIFHYEDTNGEGMCGRCEAGIFRKRPAPVKQPRYIIIDLTLDSD